MKRRLRIHEPVKSFARNRVETLSSSSARRSRFAAARRYQPFLFESIKCRVESPRCGLSSCAGFDLRLDCDPIRRVFKTQYRQKNNLLKLTERRGFIHPLAINYYTIE